jgi:hypothetical protein
MSSRRQLHLGAFMRPASIPYRRLALSRRVAGYEFQFRAYQGIDPKAGTREIRRFFYG